jgi:O-antigen ligase
MLKKYSAQLEFAIEALLLLIVFAIANRATWLCIYEIPGQLFSCEYGKRTDELLLYGISLGMVLWLVYQRKEQKRYWSFWKRNWILMLFLTLSFCSVLWSTNRAITIYISLLITVSAMIAAYLGMRYSGQQWLHFIVYFGMIIIFLSYVLVALLPGVAIMSSIGLVGNWRGVFSHKNYMGAIVAYCSAALLYLLLTDTRWGWRIFVAVFYLASIWLLVMSKSATGVILLILLDGFTIAWLAVRRWGSHLTKLHYMVMGAAVLGLILFTLLNPNRVLGLVGRSTAFTGRMPLWIYLLGNVMANHPWLGYGIGTVWDDPSFRAAAGFFAHWGGPIMNGHNGFVDILLYLGVIGLSIFLVTIILTVVRLFNYSRVENDRGYWPIMTLIYVLVANLTISFLFHFETFHWVLLVMVMFMSARPAEPIAKGILRISHDAT